MRRGRNMDDVISKIYSLSLNELTLLEKLATEEYKHRDYSFAPSLEKAGFLEKNGDGEWKVKKGVLSIEGSIQELLELRARKYEEYIYNKNYRRNP